MVCFSQFIFLQEESEEVSGSGRSSSFEERPRARPCSPASPCSNATPLLTASLNAPLQSFYSGGPVRVKCPTDLHVTLTKKSKVEASGEQAGGSQAVFYSTLLKQLLKNTIFFCFHFFYSLQFYLKEHLYCYFLIELMVDLFQGI